MTPALLLLLAAPAADPSPTPLGAADEKIHKYLKSEVDRISRSSFDGAKSKAEWEAKRPRLQEQFFDMLGLWPLPARSPLNATITGTLDHGNVVIEKLHYQSIPGLYVTGNLYRPQETGGKKLPAILYVCGHSNKGRDGNKTAYQDHGMWFATNGYVCLVVDTLQLGEVAGKHHGTYNLGRFWWHGRGYTPAGVECWNGIRGIDYLCTRPEVDPQKIGVTGISGGGATTVWVAAADDRVKVAVPVSGMSDLESYVTNHVLDGHCDCMFGYNPYQWEWTTILALFAPKPLLFANSDNDRIFPMDGNRRIIARLRKLYAMLGAKDVVDEYVSVGGHAYRPDLRVAIFGFFNQHLKHEAGPVQDTRFPPIAGKELRVFSEDTDLPKDSINDRVDEVFVPTADVSLPTAANFPTWKTDLLKRLRERSFRFLPETMRGGAPIGDYADGMMPWTTFGGPSIHVVKLNDGADLQDNLVVLNPNETVAEAKQFWTKQGGVDRRSIGLYPRGSGPDRWTRKNPPNTFERSMVLLGQTVDAGRVRDVISYLLGDPRDNPKYRLVGRGDAGVIAAYAALWAPGTVDEVVLVDPPTTHRDGPQFLGVRRVLDLPDALGLLAPDVKVTIVGVKDAKAFDKTAAIFKLAGAEAKFRRE